MRSLANRMKGVVTYLALCKCGVFCSTEVKSGGRLTANLLKGRCVENWKISGQFNKYGHKLLPREDLAYERTDILQDSRTGRCVACRVHLNNEKTKDKGNLRRKKLGDWWAWMTRGCTRTTVKHTGTRDVQ